MVAGWIAEWEALPKRGRVPLEDYLREQLEGIEPGLADVMVDTSQRNDYPDQGTSLLQLLMDDLHTYG
jgi:hypothetical protein